MLTGVLKEYHQRHPEELLDLVVLNPGCQAIWQNNPLAHQAILYPGRQPQFWNPVRFYLFDLWKVRRYGRELNRDGRYHRILFPTIQTLPELVYHLTGTYGPHKIHRIAADLGVPRKIYPYDLHPSETDRMEAEKQLARFSGKPVAVLHPFSGHTKKRISPAGFRKILERLQARQFATLVVGSAGEQKRLDPAWQTETAFGLPLGVLIALLQRGALFAGTDSSVAHLAAFANTPRLAIFSPKLEPKRYLPVSEQGQVTLIRIRRGREEDSLQEFENFLNQAPPPCSA